MLKFNLKLGLCLAYVLFLGLFQPGYAYSLMFKKRLYHTFPQIAEMLTYFMQH